VPHRWTVLSLQRLHRSGLSQVPDRSSCRGPAQPGPCMTHDVLPRATAESKHQVRNRFPTSVHIQRTWIRQSALFRLKLRRKAFT
jgi:hypothetical protein